jgi:hypothetical protein
MSAPNEPDAPPRTCEVLIFFLKDERSSFDRIFWADFALKNRGFGGFGKTSSEVKYVKSFVSITYEALVKFIRPKECVKEDPALPVEGRFYSARQNQQCGKEMPEETTTALKSSRTLTYGIVCII